MKQLNCIKFCNKKRVELNNLSSGQYSVKKNMWLKISMLMSDLCDYNDAYIIVKGIISVTGTNGAKRRNKNLVFKNNATFRSCITKINNTFVAKAEDLDIAISACIFLEYSGNYSMTLGSFWNYYRDERNDDENENDDNDNNINNNETTASKFFKCNAKIIRNTPDNAELD